MLFIQYISIKVISNIFIVKYIISSYSIGKCVLTRYMKVLRIGSRSSSSI